MSQYSLSPWMKNATPFVYLRLSTEYQVADDAKKPLDKQSWAIDQLGSIKDYLKRNGLKTPSEKRIFRDLASGGTFDRPGLNQLLEDIMNHKGRAFIAIAEPARWGRNTVRGNVAYGPLYERDIPMLSTSDGLMSGTASEPRPNAQFLFAIKQGVSEGERGAMQERVNRKIQQRKKGGVKSAATGTLFPFARQDPLTVLRDNIALVNVPVNQGGGGSALGRLVATASAPYGASPTWANNARKREVNRVAKLTQTELMEWNAYRDKIREITKERDYDPTRGANPVSLKRRDIDFGMKALYRMVGGYLGDPSEPNYRPLTNAQINEILTNPRDYLSDADKKLYRRLVSKR